MSERDMALTPTNDRPTSIGRLPKEMAVYELLEKLEIPYLRLDHEVTASIEDCHNVDQLLGIHICKNLFLCNTQKTDFYLLMMPGEKKFKTKELSSQIGSARLSFAGPEFMEEFLNITPGSVSVMGLMNDHGGRVRLLIDQDVLKEEYVGCHPCINTSSLKLKTADVFSRFLKAVHHDLITVHLTGES